MPKREYPFPEDEHTLVGIPAPLHLPARPAVVPDPEREDTVIDEIPWWEVLGAN